MPLLAEVQQALRAHLLAEPGPDAIGVPASGWCAGEPSAVRARLATYQATSIGTLVNALRLAYPAVRRVLGGEYFDAIAARFARATPPTSACLDDYGAPFAQFAAKRPEAVSLHYLEDVARLDWAVNCALHAPDLPGLASEGLLALGTDCLAHVCFRAHPRVRVLAVDYPAEQIWQAVLEEDEAALRQIDLSAGQGWLLVERDATLAIQIRRLPEAVGRLSAQLLAGAPLHIALEAAGSLAASPSSPPLSQRVLADHLAAGRFTGFFLQDPPQKECAS